MTTALTVLNLVPPRVIEAYGSNGDRLNFNDIYTSPHINVRVQYEGVADRHTVRVRSATGRYIYNTETLTVGTSTYLSFRIPRLEVIDAIGSVMTCNYSVRTLAGAPLIISKSLSLHIDPQDFDLSEPRLAADRKNVTVKFLNMTRGYTVRVRWHGVVVHDTETQPILNDSSMSFAIPPIWITENLGKTVVINYSHHRSGSNDNLMFSRLLRIAL